VETGGVVPMNWLAVASEWQRDWARQGLREALGELACLTPAPPGPAFVWELQLFGQKAGVAS
jgi:hypothetical protein